MISVCIPIHNYCVVPLLLQLAQQRQKANEKVEFVCIDDHSDPTFLKENAPIAAVSRYLLLPQNIGRARIRNLFLQYAKGDFLLFLDDDCLLPDNFLNNYIKQLEDSPYVVVGGTTYTTHKDNPQHHLRYLYGTQVETRNAAIRNKHPYSAFTCNNFMVRKDIFANNRFDVSIVKYGHEDTVFGYQLQRNGIPINHIDNPVEYTQVDSNSEFLEKSRQALENLSELYDRYGSDPLFGRSVRILRAYERLKKQHLLSVISMVYKMLKPSLESHFIEGVGISLRQFNFYKIGYFIQLQESKHQHPTL